MPTQLDSSVFDTPTAAWGVDVLPQSLHHFLATPARIPKDCANSWPVAGCHPIQKQNVILQFIYNIYICTNRNWHVVVRLLPYFYSLETWCSLHEASASRFNAQALPNSPRRPTRPWPQLSSIFWRRKTTSERHYRVTTSWHVIVSFNYLAWLKIVSTHHVYIYIYIYIYVYI